MNLERATGAAPSTSLVRGRSRARRGARVVMLGLALLVAGAATAHARDLCMDYQGGGHIVWKRAKLGGKNRCTPLQGVDTTVGGVALTGMACTSAGGHWVTLTYTAHDYRANTSYFEAANCRLYLPLEPTGYDGLCTGTFISTPGSTGRFAQYAHFSACDVNVPD
jgi:hypothetical protein